MWNLWSNGLIWLNLKLLSMSFHEALDDQRKSKMSKTVESWVNWWLKNSLCQLNSKGALEYGMDKTAKGKGSALPFMYCGLSYTVPKIQLVSTPISLSRWPLGYEKPLPLTLTFLLHSCAMPCRELLNVFFFSSHRWVVRRRHLQVDILLSIWKQTIIIVSIRLSSF